MRILIALVLVVAVVMDGAVAAADGPAGIVVEAPWARASILQSRPSAAYMTIRNTSDEPDRLLAVSSLIAEHASIHAMERSGDAVRMHPLPNLTIGPGQTVVLEPGAMHLMLMGLRRKVFEGEQLQLVLDFERAGRIEVNAEVLPFAAKGP